MKKIKQIFGDKEIEISGITTLFSDKPLKLKNGKEISNVNIAYRTYGKLNEDKSNVILICHSLTGDQYVAESHPVTGKDGWWDHYVGSGKAIDTDRYFIICSNVIGSCMGSLGPKDVNPETGQRYNLDFPIITIGDMVKAQKELIDSLGITRLNAVIGGSMGGMQTLEWLSKHAEIIDSAIVISTASKHSAQNIAFNEVGRQAIIADENWCGGKYIEEGKNPSKGLSIARMMAHITYLSEDGLQRKFGRNLQDRENLTYGFDADFQIESYLRYQGMSFVDRFDPNSYLYVTRAMDYFDLEAEYDGSLAKAFKNVKCPVSVISFSSDWLFTSDDAKQIVMALSAGKSEVSFVNIESDKGHDAFLLPDERLEGAIRGFLK